MCVYVCERERERLVYKILLMTASDDHFGNMGYLRIVPLPCACYKDKFITPYHYSHGKLLIL